jgi:hypothetical protein
VVGILAAGDFCGEGCLVGQVVRMGSATTMVDSECVRIEKPAMIKMVHDDPAFSETFVTHLLARNARVEADLIDQLFNSSERRLARLLLILANFGKEGSPADHSSDPSRNPCGDDWHDPFARQLFHEQVSAPTPEIKWVRKPVNCANLFPPRPGQHLPNVARLLTSRRRRLDQRDAPPPAAGGQPLLLPTAPAYTSAKT